MRQLFDSTFASSFRHERISTVGKIYTKMQMQDLLNDFNLINYKQQMTTMGCMVDHIHLDKKYILHTLPKRITCSSLLIIHVIVTVYIHREINYFKFHKQQRVGVYSFKMIYIHT
jgi:hypothetical protein